MKNSVSQSGNYNTDIRSAILSKALIQQQIWSFESRSDEEGSFVVENNKL